MLNRAFGITRLADLSSIYVPIYTPTQTHGLSPYIQFNEYSRYHTSAILASAIETNSLPFRLKNNPLTMAETVSKFNWVRSTSLASLSVSVPLPILKNGYIDTLEKFKTQQLLRPTLSLLDRVSTEVKTDCIYMIRFLFIHSLYYTYSLWMYMLKPL
jgi:hypothetical protein